MEEIWKAVLGYEGYYEISNWGNVKSINRTIITSIGHKNKLKSKLLKYCIDKGGYFNVGLSKNNKTKRYLVHNLEAKTFIPNPENKPTVNHIDGIKTNNYIDNLEWATISEQAIHALKYKLRVMPNNGRNIIQLNSNGEKVNKFNDVHEAQRLTNIGYSSIWKCCNNQRKTAGGFIWKYL